MKRLNGRKWRLCFVDRFPLFRLKIGLLAAAPVNKPRFFPFFLLMKLRLLLVLLLHTALIQAQDIPFIKADQIDRWKQSDTDTVWVLNFWATWCGPCVAELPSFEKLNREYASQKVQVILVSNDFKKQVDSKVNPFVAKKKLKSRVVFMDESNPNNWIDRVSPEWSGAIPATLIISKRKDKYLFFEKQLTYEELEAAVKEALQR